MEPNGTTISPPRRPNLVSFQNPTEEASHAQLSCPLRTQTPVPLRVSPPLGWHKSKGEIRRSALVETARTKRVREELVKFVAGEALKTRAGERLLGSSEVIESIFGKLKRIERDQARSGFTALVLSIPAMVSTTTQEVIHKALETVPTKKVAEWAKRFLGQSIQAQRKEAFRGTSNKEQKPDQLHAPA